ncbi:MAG: galactokinase [Bacteroidales bacterium]|nr:galactokinase [Bacteroidales bacterium]MCB9013884.1 galactokinase [Bacteroidales bacterium]
MNIQELSDLFCKKFNTEKKGISSFFSPGRVNLIGEHTDYNGGYVFPCALNFGTTLLVKENNKGMFRFATTNFEKTGEVSIKPPFEKTGSDWYYYPLGVIDQFSKLGVSFTGLDFLFSGDIPNGAGLSSSASIEMVTAACINELFSVGINMVSLVKLSQKAENQFIGVNCGIMDQFAVGMGAKNKAIFLNCDTLDYELVPLEISGYKLVISNTNKRRGLADSKYNERRAECDTAVENLSQVRKIRNLSELSYSDFLALQDKISNPVVRQRTKHVISENQRVLEAIEALKSSDLIRFGKLMNESHDSLRYDYEVTGIELDTLVELARKVPGVLGSRMTGAGFGGCTVSLVKESSVDDFIKNVGKAYQEKTGLQADFYVAEVGNGTIKLS